MKTSRQLFWFLLVLPMLIFFSASAQTIPDFQVNDNASPDGSEQSEPCVDGDGHGNYVVVWKDKRSGTGSDFWAQVFLDNGMTHGPNFRVGDAELDGAKYSPAVAVDQDLNFIVCWLNRRFMKVDVYARRISSDGTFIGDSFMVNEDWGNIESSCPNVSFDDDGNIIFVWADERNGDWDIYAQRYANDGEAIGGNILVNDDGGSANQYWASIAGDRNGDTIVTWADHRSGNYDIYVQRISGDGSMPGTNIRVDTDSSGSTQYLPVVTAGGNGNYIVAWQDSRNEFSDIYAQLYSGDDQAIGTNIPVTDIDLQVSKRGPSISSDNAGNFVVGWNDARNIVSDVFVQRFTFAGLPLGPVIRANDGSGETSQSDSDATMDDDGNFFMVWEDRRLGFKGDVFAQAFSSDGSQVGEDIKVNDDIGSGDQTDPAIAIDDDGHFIVVWADHPGGPKSLLAQRYLIDGTELGEPFIVTDELGSTDPGEPDVAFDGDGNFVVAWVDFTYGAKYGCNIFGRRFSNQGLALGGTFRVDTGTHSTYGASVACQSDGGFMICWCDEEDGSKGSEPDVYVQHYRRDGSTDGVNFMINDDGGTTAQRSPQIAIDGNDNYIVVWVDDRDTDEYPYFQRIASDGTILGTNQRIQSTVARHYQGTASVSTDAAGNFVICWIHEQDGHRGIYAQRFKHDATELGPVFQVDRGDGDILVSLPVVTVSDDGKFVVAWTEVLDGDNDVYAQDFNSDGSCCGGNYLISSTPQWIQTQPDVTFGYDQIFFTWRDNRGGQTQFDIYAKVLGWNAPLDVDHPGSPVPASQTFLDQNFPNPFNPSTIIRYRIAEESQVILDVFSIRGEKVDTLVDRIKEPGIYQVNFDASGLSSGTYFYRLQAGSIRQTGKMVILK